ncbi:MAG: archaellin/type IV pilin N-terminal domain-containing protein [Candidatus Bathyarchaeia archaeon]
MKMLKSKKALSPVVASIILIAVTVAVSIAVAAWMGALSFSFMSGGESLQVGTPWGWSAYSVYVNVTNTGGSTVTISTARVNGTIATVTPNYGNLTLQPKQSAGLNITIPTTAGWSFTTGYTYTITLVTANNKEFPTTGTYNP